MAEKLKWEHFDAVEMARFLHLKVDQVKAMTPRELCAITMRQISLNARLARMQPGVGIATYPAPTTPAKGN